MLQKSKGENDPHRADRKNDDNSQVGWWLIVVAGLILLGVIALAGFTLIEHKDRVTFLTVNTLSALIAEAVAMQVYIYRKQWKAMNRQADTMKDTLDLGQENAETAKDQMISTLRAYVSPTRGEGAGNWFRITIENTGLTPAKNVAVRHVLGQGFNAPHFSDADADDFTYVGVLASGRDFPLEVQGPELTSEVNQIMGCEPEFRVWIAADITYLDVFGNPRETEFCMYRKYGDTTLRAWPMRGYELTEEAETAN